MELKRTGNGLTTIILALMVALLVSYETFAVVYLFTAGDWKALFGPAAYFGIFFVFIVVAVTMITCAILFGVIKRGPYIRALKERDPSLISIASPQPDRSLALRDGETLVLAYHRKRSGWRSVLAGFGFFLFTASSGEVLIFSTLPVFGHSLLNPFYLSLLYPPAATSSPSPLDWLAAAFPLVIAVIILVAVLRDTVAARLSILTADDQGISTSKGFRRRMIPWNDIVLFARLGAFVPSNPVGAYALWGRSHALGFSVVSPRVIEIDNAPSQGKAQYVFDGGYESYLANAQRLFATITARAYTPLLVAREAPLVERMRRRAPILTTNEEAALALPIASQEYQPRVDTTNVPLMAGEQLTFRARIAPLPVVGETILWMILVGPVLFLCAGSQGAFTPLESLGPLVTAITLAICLPFLALIAAVIPLQRRSNKLPAITVNAVGIGGRVSSERKPIMIPWQSITAWIVIPPPAGTNKPARYIVYGDENKLHWAEPPDAQLAGRGITGDRQEAYRAMAMRIHTLIAVRSGQPLREFRTDAVPAARL